ncbi:MAG: membrane protein insertase YidC [Prevotellaceae bacterium]|jgi:YidC/Oxa1 family membrane protein insertase|nr:membrane protein insertase YidC [Prevotellaceae bacterium]
MDKNTLTAFALIGLLFVGFYWLNKPTEEQRKLAEQQRIEAQAAAEMQQQTVVQPDALTLDTAKIAADREGKFGVFAQASLGENKTETVETDLLKIDFSNKGGKISAVELKKYRTHDSLPLVLFSGEEENDYGFYININNRSINTSDLFFEALPLVKNDTAQIITMRLAVNENSHLDFVYTIPNDNYMLKFDIVSAGMQDIRGLEMFWHGKVRQQEKGRDFEGRYSGLYYKFWGKEVENLSESKPDSKKIETGLKWIAFKDQFFSSILIADDKFSSPNLESNILNDKYLKEYSVSKMTVPFKTQDGDKTGFRFYFGPNHFKTLNDYDKGLNSDQQLDLQKLVPLGWTLFRWINRVLVIPMFNFFGGFGWNFGIVILLMTIVIKLLLFPLTYKSYMSSAKMRVLKPEIEKINERIPANKPQDRQKATMELYGKVGVSPMGGCLPMLLQMPILIAMFSFFPAAIELRQQSFLWAPDLSTYDSILNLPFNIPFYGAHVSLFCLLMSIVNVIYTHINMATQDMGNQQIPGMKYIMYLMPVMFLFFFNSYASGLSYYYLISTLITIGQTYAIRATVDEDKLLAQLNENRKKPAKKKGFLARLEEAQRKQLEAQKKGKKR